MQPRGGLLTILCNPFCCGFGQMARTKQTDRKPVESRPPLAIGSDIQPVSDDVTDHDYDDARSSLSDVHDVTVNCPSTVSTSACANYDCDATVVDGSVCVDTAISDNLMQIDTVTVETSVVRDDISKTCGVVPHKDIENCAIETVTKKSTKHGDITGAATLKKRPRVNKSEACKLAPTTSHARGDTPAKKLATQIRHRSDAARAGLRDRLLAGNSYVYQCRVPNCTVWYSHRTSVSRHMMKHHSVPPSRYDPIKFRASNFFQTGEAIIASVAPATTASPNQLLQRNVVTQIAANLPQPANVSTSPPDGQDERRRFSDQFDQALWPSKSQTVTNMDLIRSRTDYKMLNHVALARKLATQFKLHRDEAMALRHRTALMLDTEVSVTRESLRYLGDPDASTDERADRWRRRDCEILAREEVGHFG